MRCLNCQTVMAANDTHCYSCGMKLTVPVRGWVKGYTYGPGEPVAPKGSNLRFTPVGSDGKPLPRSGGAGVGRWLGILVLLGLAGLFGLGAAALLIDTPQESTPPRAVTAAELLEIKDVKKLSDEWVVYDAPRVVDTEVQIVSGRGRRQTRTILVLAQVQDRWLIVQVPPDFSGNRLEGRLQEWDSPLYLESMGKVRAKFPQVANRLLPYQLNAETERAEVDRQGTRLFGGGLGVVGLVCLVIGLKLAFVRSSVPAY
jgi:hypothetical protein